MTKLTIKNFETKATEVSTTEVLGGRRGNDCVFYSNGVRYYS